MEETRNRAVTKSITALGIVFAIDNQELRDNLAHEQGHVFALGQWCGNHRAKLVAIGDHFFHIELVDDVIHLLEIYRAGQEKAIEALPVTLSGEAVLPGFELQVEQFVD